ncbi:MAG TPA: methyltransferase domain-containing protein [Actinomycetes bacterium]|nr:methyltransferase domain-containing protein [Actinomycetes bacterium]
MKLTDPTHGLKRTKLEALELAGETLDAHRDFWDRSADVDSLTAIVANSDERDYRSSGRAEAEALRRFLGPDATVLDIGCGTGRVMEHLAPWCREVHGIDISERMVQGGRERLEHLPNVRFHHGNGYDLAGFGDGSFEVVYSIVALQHMPRTVAYNYLLESHRVLRQGGVLWLYVPNLLRDDAFAAFHHFSQPWFVSHPYPMNFYTPQEISRLLVAAGLWLEHLNDEMRVEARKTSSAGISEQAQELVGLHDAEKQRLGRRNAELERALERIRSQPLMRLASAARRRLRRKASLS